MSHERFPKSLKVPKRYDKKRLEIYRMLVTRGVIVKKVRDLRKHIRLYLVFEFEYNKPKYCFHYFDFHSIE